MSDGKPTIDETDLELLRHVETDFGRSLQELADDLGLSKSAVHYRLKKLKDSDIIEGTTADLNPVPLGLDMVAITDIYVHHEQGYAEDIGTRLAAIDGVEQVYYTMGDVDFVVISRVKNRDRLNEIIDRIIGIEGVNKTSSRFVMDEIKSNPKVLAHISHDRIEDVVSGD